MLNTVLSAFNVAGTNTIEWGNGLINKTWKAKAADGVYILQRLNTSIFKNPEDIACNIEAVGWHILHKKPDAVFPLPIKTKSGDLLFTDATGNYFRLLPFVSGSHTVDVLQHPAQAYEAALQFGKFTKMLRDFDVQRLKITLPNFHNLSLRYAQFTHALANGNAVRITESAELIKLATANTAIVDSYEKIKSNPQFRVRVTHHDSKISNVLFDDHDKGICVIDLDTIMPGYFISDVGDMIRTYLSPVSEEENDFSKIDIRTDFFEALAKGYISQMKDELTKDELHHFVYAGNFMIYMQALRFLTDYINNDVYYGSKYKGHNLVRAGNQFTLLQKIQTQEQSLQAIVNQL
jgi:Ser/Thr protein kinase RdoA (MazF antagonist)